MASSQSVLFTGATGSLGAIILEQLLLNGNTVTAVLRSFKKAKAPLEETYAKEIAAGQLQFVEIQDMAAPDAFHNAAKGKLAIIHVATPLSDDNYLDDMITPAQKIIDNVLNAAAAEPSVKRVIVTGSIVSVFSFLDYKEVPKTYTEADFNNITLENALRQTSLAYTYSKTSTEQRAWEYMNKTSRSFDLIFILAPSIIGRSIQPGFKAAKGPLGGISAIYRELFDRDRLGSVFPYIMGIDDVAKTHVMSLNPSVPGNERYIIYSHDVSMDKFANAIRERYPALRTRVPPPSDIDSWSPPTKFDKSKADKVFGTDWKGWEEALYDVVDDILSSEKEHGIAK